MGTLIIVSQDCLSAGVLNPNEIQIILAVAILPPLNPLHY